MVSEGVGVLWALQCQLLFLREWRQTTSCGRRRTAVAVHSNNTSSAPPSTVRTIIHDWRISKGTLCPEGALLYNHGADNLSE